MLPQPDREGLSRGGGHAANLGDLVRGWRKRKGISQMMLAFECGISTRHLSFIECGRAIPSRGVIRKIAFGLELDQAAQNRLLTTAGLVPERNLGAVDGTLDFGEVETLLRAIHPVPALALDPAWNIVGTNLGITSIFQLLGYNLANIPSNFLSLCFRSVEIDTRLSNANKLKSQLTLRVLSQYESEHYMDSISIINSGDRDWETERHDIYGNNIIKTAIPFNIISDNSRPNMEFILTFFDFIGLVPNKGKCSVISFFPGNSLSRNYCHSLENTSTISALKTADWRRDTVCTF